jgi:hypothetical protein
MMMKQLNEKAMLVKLTVRRANLTKRDQVAEAVIQQQMDDTSLIVNSKLFRDSSNPINRIMQEASGIYIYHKNNTLGYIDKGPRILPNNNYMEYTHEMRQRITHVDAMLDKELPNYDRYVQLDIMYRSKNQVTSRAKIADYPTAEEFRERMGFDLRFSPLPDEKHFLFDLSDDDRLAFRDSIKEAEKVARRETILSMLTPLQHLVTKLNIGIGEKESVFRDSAIENVLDGLQRARKLNIDEDPELQEAIGNLSSAITVFDKHKDALRESPIVREQAHKKLNDLASKMRGLI